MNIFPITSSSPLKSLLLLAAGLLISLHTSMAQTAPLKIGIIGDSTVSEFPATAPYRGWGQALPGFFATDVTFLNKAKAGASSKTFPPERWQEILAFNPDFVLIEFGFNDQHARTQPESTDAGTDFKDNLKTFITEARQANIVPILVTPNHRRTFDAQGQLTRELEPYVLAMKEVGAEQNVPVVDLYDKSATFYQTLGEDGSTPFTVNNTDKADRPGKGDRTHFTEQGAQEMARLVAAGLAETDPRLKTAIQTPANP